MQVRIRLGTAVLSLLVFTGCSREQPPAPKVTETETEERIAADPAAAANFLISGDRDHWEIIPVKCDVHPWMDERLVFRSRQSVLQRDRCRGEFFSSGSPSRKICRGTVA